MTATALLDVNVLVALFDPAHVHHEPAHAWFASERQHGWASCCITENALIRILSHPRYGPIPMRSSEVGRRLAEFEGSGGHVPWPADASLTDTALFRLDRVAGPKQLTDVYLLGLVVARQGRLVTFDRSIPIGAVVGATPEHLVVPP